MKLDLDAWADEYAGTLYALARDDFGLCRQLIHPDFLWGWWTDDVARELQRFYLDLRDGRRPKLALMAPPQHGKSMAVLDFIAWIAGKHPTKQSLHPIRTNSARPGIAFCSAPLLATMPLAKSFRICALARPAGPLTTTLSSSLVTRGLFATPQSTARSTALVSTLAWSTIRLKVPPKPIPSSTAIRLGRGSLTTSSIVSPRMPGC
jgi:hypothetical protein